MARARERRAGQKAAPAVDPPQAEPLEQDGDMAWQERVLAFAVELRGTLSNGQLHETIATKLPPMLGVDQLWIETTIGGQRKMMAAPIAGDGPAAHPLMEAPGEWATFPLRAAETVVGVIGVPVTHRALSPASRRALASLAPLLGDSLQTAHTIQQLRELSTIDSVTGCATRADGLERFRAELKRAHRASQQVAVLMLDLDYFKSINDRYGHQCGDSVLAAIGHTIMQTLRVSDLRCRWGGEEFLVALPESGLDQAKRVAVTLARRIAGTVTEYDSARIQLTTSVGITIALPGEEDLDAVLARADAALYRAKADGRNCIRVVLANPDDGSMTMTPPPALPFRDRRNPEQPDRRQYRGPGRRTTDFGRAVGPPTDVSADDEARVRATPV
jgi:diguanylate cyclase (GGDEF)-like protein